MFANKGLFSEIACPYQKTCLLPECIFSHSRTQDETTNADVISPSQALVAQENEDEQRVKRRKTAQQQNGVKSPGSLVHVETGINGEKAQTKPAKDLEGKLPSRPLAKPKREILGIDREISPPPPRNRPSNTRSGPEDTSAASANGAPPPAKSEASVVPRTSVQKRPVKEVLNPRPVKGPAPASFSVRYQLVNALHSQLTRLNNELKKELKDQETNLLLSDQQLISKALDIEEDATPNPLTYSGLVKQKVLYYKKMKIGDWKTTLQKEKAQEESRDKKTPASKPNAAPRVFSTGLSSTDEISILCKLYAEPEELVKYGFVVTIPSDEDIETAQKGIEAAQGWEICDRCKSRFQVFPGRREEDGALASGGSCTYHFGKPYFVDRAPGEKGKKERKYRCCNELVAESAGCTKADNHVFLIKEPKRMAAVWNFEKTPYNREKSSERPVCIDAEMGYTTSGFELIRLTATAWSTGEELFDVLVRPFGEILDLNSRFSGVWPQDIADAYPYSSESKKTNPTPLKEGERRKYPIVDSPAAARSLLFTHLTPSTPLIGHGLENDLNATRIIHPTIIDTALLFPHKAGPPYRNGLKALMKTHLNRDVQVVVDGKLEGHDSKEDANSAGMLAHYRLSLVWERMKNEGWTVEAGIFNPPAKKEVEGPLGLSAGTKRTRDEWEKNNEEGEIEE